MKLNTLLLSSAAVLIAGSAFAADLPSKKAAPAAAVTVCKVGDLTGFTLPGGDTCFDISGRVTVDVITNGEGRKSNDGNADSTIDSTLRLNFDAQSNTEIGVVRSFGRLENGAITKAYVQFSGFTAGIKDSLTDIYGTSGVKPTLAGNSDTNGIDYQFKAGGLGVGIGLENGADNNFNAAGVGDRPNIVGSLSFATGPVTAKIAAASHQSRNAAAGTNDGYAVKGSLAAALGQVNVIAFGGTAKGASSFIIGKSSVSGSGVNVADLYANGDQSIATSYGGEINTKLGNLLIAVEAAQYNYEKENSANGAGDRNVTEYGVYTSYALAKGLSIQPEYYRTTGDSKSDVIQVRIQRDF